MKNLKWIILIIVIVIGFAFESAKQVTQPNHSKSLNHILGADDHVPFVRDDSESVERSDVRPPSSRSRRRMKSTRLGRTSSQDLDGEAQGGSMDLGIPPTAYDDGDSDADTEGPANQYETDEGEGEDEDSVAEDQPCPEEDEECQAAIARKKAEETANKLKEKQAKLQENSDAETTEDNKDETSDENAEPAPVTGTGGGIATRQNQEPQPATDELITEWVNRLSRQADYKVANEFAKLRQGKQISRDVYYEVVDQLIEDPREEIQIVGVYLLASFQSADSFEKLVVTADAAPFGSRLNKQTELYIKAYKKVNNLKHLSTILGSSTDSNVLKQAIKLVNASAKSQLKSDIKTSDTNPTTLSADSAKFYRVFIDLFDEIAESINDNETASLATSALEELQELLPPEESTVAAIE